MTTNARFVAASLLTTLALGACDAQQSTDYVGDPIFTMKGSLRGDNGVASDTQVALMWDGEGVRVLSGTEVEGNFPAEFTLRLYEPPPERALLSLERWGIDVKIGFGNIVAAVPDAPLYPQLLGYESADEVELEPGETLVPDEDWSWLRGGVPAYLVLYVEGDVPANLGCLAEFDEGYNLLALRDYTEAEAAQIGACFDGAFEAALSEYNAEHGTTYTEETLEENAEAYDAVDAAAGLKGCEAGCALLKAHSARVDTDQRVTMELEPDVEFVDWN